MTSYGRASAMHSRAVLSGTSVPLIGQCPLQHTLLAGATCGRRAEDVLGAGQWIAWDVSSPCPSSYIDMGKDSLLHLFVRVLFRLGLSFRLYRIFITSIFCKASLHQLSMLHTCHLVIFPYLGLPPTVLCCDCQPAFTASLLSSRIFVGRGIIDAMYIYMTPLLPVSPWPIPSSTIFIHASVA